MTRQLYKCLGPAYNSEAEWNATTSLSSEAKVELEFWRSKIKKLNGFAIKPVIPSITSCQLIAGDSSGSGTYMAKFSDLSETLLSRKFTAFERRQSSTYRESIGVCDLYSCVDSPIVRFRGQQIVHITDNQGVETIFQIGSPVESLQKWLLKSTWRSIDKFHSFFKWKSLDNKL